MKEEIGAVRAENIAQGGLSQGQQTQIARNEQSMPQILIFVVFSDISILLDVLIPPLIADKLLYDPTLRLWKN